MALPMRIQHIGVIALALATQGCTGFEIHANTELGPVKRKPEQKEAVDDAPPPPPDESNVGEIVVEPGMAPVVRKSVMVVASIRPEELAFNYMCGDEGEERYVSKIPDVRLALPEVMPRLQVGVPQKVWGLLVSNGERFWCKKAKTEHGALLNLADLPPATYDLRIVLATQGAGEYRLELRDPNAPR
jgi:hypothetical protein